MKRPKLEYAENCTLIHTYARKLEEYCDELEKALDKACELIKKAASIGLIEDVNNDDSNDEDDF